MATELAYDAGQNAETMDVDFDLEVDVAGDAAGVAGAADARPGGAANFNSGEVSTTASGLKIIQPRYGPDLSPPEGDPCPEKVHIIGLDDMSNANLKEYLSGHGVSPSRIEWVNDTSANLVYESSEQGQEALQKLSADPGGAPADDRQGRKAHEFSNPKFPVAIKLWVRVAVSGDVKAPRARHQSRYYLLHTDEDPGEIHDNSNHNSGNGRSRNRSREGRDRNRRRSRSNSPGKQRARSSWQEDKDDLFAVAPRSEEADLFSPAAPASRLDAMFAEREDKQQRSKENERRAPDELFPAYKKDYPSPPTDFSIKDAAKRPGRGPRVSVGSRAKNDLASRIMLSQNGAAGQEDLIVKGALRISMKGNNPVPNPAPAPGRPSRRRDRAGSPR